MAKIIIHGRVKCLLFAIARLRLPANDKYLGNPRSLYIRLYLAFSEDMHLFHENEHPYRESHTCNSLVNSLTHDWFDKNDANLKTDLLSHHGIEQ